MKVHALLPIKAASERVPGKNLRAFNGRPLFHVIIDTLLTCELLEAIIVDTDSIEVKRHVQQLGPRVNVFDRPEDLRGHGVVANELIDRMIGHCGAEHFLQTHCTNPLLSAGTIDRAIRRYAERLHRSDSLISTTAIQARMYDKAGEPLAHVREKMLRTQDMSPVHVENSNIFIFSRTSFRTAGNSRVGLRPELFGMSAIESIDIDHEEDFLLAELIEQHRQRFPSVFHGS